VITEDLDSPAVFINRFTADPIKVLHFTILVWSTICNFWHLGVLALRTEWQSARISQIKNSGLDQYGAEPFRQQQFETSGIEGVKKTFQLQQLNALAVNSTRF